MQEDGKAISIRANVEVCPECSSDDIRESPTRGELFCNNCGLVLSDFILSKNYDEEEKPEASGEKATTGNFDGTLQTYVGEESEIDTPAHRKLRKNNRYTRYKDTNKAKTQGLVEIQRVTSKLSLPETIKDDSIVLFSELQENGFMQGPRTVECTVAGCIYWSCRQFRVPRTKNEIASELDVHTSKLNSIYLKICDELETGHLPFSAKEYLNRYLNEFGINGEKRKNCIQIIEETETNGCSARSIVGSVIRLVTYDENISLREISNVVEISKQRIREKSKEMRGQNPNLLSS